MLAATAVAEGYPAAGWAASLHYLPAWLAIPICVARIVDVRTDFSFGKPRMLFERTGYTTAVPSPNYDVSLDSQRFLMINGEQRKPTPVTEMTFIQNWIEELKRLVPTGKK